MMLPLWSFASVCLLIVANCNPTFEGYWYEKPSIAFEYPTVIKMLPKNADIKPTTAMKLANEKKLTKSQLNSGTAAPATIKATMTTMATVTATATYQQHHPKQQQHLKQKEKSHEIEKIEKSTVINPTAIKETNLNIKSNKNPQTSTSTPPIATIKTTTERSRDFVIKTKTDKLSLNQLSNTPTLLPSTSKSCSLYVAHDHNNLNFVTNSFIKTTNSAEVLASQEAALEHVLNQDNDYIYRVASKVPLVNNLDNSLPHTQHDGHHDTKRLKLKHEVSHKDYSIKDETLKYCCEQTFASLKERFNELALNRPIERRLTLYTNTLKEKEYFE